MVLQAVEVTRAVRREEEEAEGKAEAISRLKTPPERRSPVVST